MPVRPAPQRPCFYLLLHLLSLVLSSLYSFFLLPRWVPISTASHPPSVLLSPVFPDLSRVILSFLPPGSDDATPLWRRIPRPVQPVREPGSRSLAGGGRHRRRRSSSLALPVLISTSSGLGTPAAWADCCFSISFLLFPRTILLRTFPYLLSLHLPSSLLFRLLFFFVPVCFFLPPFPPAPLPWKSPHSRRVRTSGVAATNPMPRGRPWLGRRMGDGIVDWSTAISTNWRPTDRSPRLDSGIYSDQADLGAPGSTRGPRPPASFRCSGSVTPTTTDSSRSSNGSRRRPRRTDLELKARST